MATLKRWRILRHARCSSNQLTSAAKTVLTLELQRRKAPRLVQTGLAAARAAARSVGWA
jgi:hypothetical protein